MPGVSICTGHFAVEDVIGLALQRLLDLDGVFGDVGWRGPQSRCRHFRIGVRSALHGLAVIAIGRGGIFAQIGRQRLFIGAVGHADGRQH